MAAFTVEERKAFFGSIGHDMGGAEHLLGLSSSETSCFLDFRRRAPGVQPAADSGTSEHNALYEKHRKACRVRLIEPGE
jgi:hypothetical protein